jgi:hypothetical protein
MGCRGRGVIAPTSCRGGSALVVRAGRDFRSLLRIGPMPLAPRRQRPGGQSRLCMTRIYLTAAKHTEAIKLAEALLSDGVPAQRIRIISADSKPLATPLGVEGRHADPRQCVPATVLGAMLGLLFGLPLLQLGPFGLAPLAVLVIIGAVSGALAALWRLPVPAQDYPRLHQALRRGETLVVVDVSERRAAEIEHMIKSSHPGVAVLAHAQTSVLPFA